MFRKITLAVVPAAAIALMLCATDNSQAFARGGRGGNGMRSMSFHRNFHNRYFGRYYGWGYPYSYGYETPVCACSTCEAPVVAETVAPVCTTCEPVYTASYPYSWGYGRYNHFGHFHNFRGGRGRR